MLIEFLIAFLVLGIVATALGVIISRDAMYSALCLTANLVLLGGVFVVLRYPFLGLAQILVYSGAVMVVFLFCLHVLSDEVIEDNTTSFSAKGFVALVSTCIISALIWATRSDWKELLSANLEPKVVSTKALAEGLFGPYVLVFELTSVLLLIALLGIMVYAVPAVVQSIPEEAVSDEQ